MLPPMRTPRRIPLTAYAGAGVLAAVGLPALAAVAWRTLVWQTPAPPDTLMLLGEPAAVAAALGLLIAGQVVLLVRVRREIHDAGAAGDASGLQAAATRALGSARLASAAGAATLLAYLAVVVGQAVRVAGAGFDWPAFGLALAALNGPALIAVLAPAALVGLRDP